MTNQELPYNLATIRKLLHAAFTAEELRRFCWDRPFFRPIVDQFGPSYGLDDMVDEVIIYCEAQLLFAELLTEVEAKNPRQYARFEQDLYAQSFELEEPPPPPIPRVSPGAVVSPFIAGPPITQPYHFFGRERELKRLFNLWRRLPLQNAAIIGPRRSGKTSLLLYLKDITTTPVKQLRPDQHREWLPEPEGYRWIYVDFQDPRLGSREGLLRYLLTHLNLSVPEPCDLDRFMDVVSRHLRVPTVILLDEIGAALRRCPELDDAFWEGLRALASNLVEGNLAFVLSAHESPVQLAHNCGHSSPFFNIFGYTARLGPLTKVEARKLIASSPIGFPAEDIDWILTRSKCWPILLQILCRECLLTLQEGDSDSSWRRDAEHQMEPFNHLLGVNL